MAKQPNRYFAPLVIAGITVGVLAKAYHSIFKKKKIDKTLKPVENIAKEDASDLSEKPNA